MKGAKPNLSNVIPMKGDAPRPVPKSPSYMTEKGAEVWEELAPILTPKDRLLPEYHYQFAVYCECVANFILATGKLACEGTFYEIKGRNGVQKKRNPAAVAQGEAMNNMRRDSALFGLSPVDAARLNTGEQGDLFDQVLAQLNGSD